MHLSLPTQTSHVGLHGHYFLELPPQVRASALFHAPGLDQHPSALQSSQSPSGLGNLLLFPNCLCIYCNTNQPICQPNARYNPTKPMANATTFTVNCGRFLTRMVHERNARVPMNAAMIFQGYASGPAALSTCMAIMAAAPVHCRVLSICVCVMCVL